jgi:hypothetical protein
VLPSDTHELLDKNIQGPSPTTLRRQLGGRGILVDAVDPEKLTQQRHRLGRVGYPLPQQRLELAQPLRGLVIGRKASGVRELRGDRP